MFLIGFKQSSFFIFLTLFVILQVLSKIIVTYVDIKWFQSLYREYYQVIDTDIDLEAMYVDDDSFTLSDLENKYYEKQKEMDLELKKEGKERKSKNMCSFVLFVLKEMISQCRLKIKEYFKL